MAKRTALGVVATAGVLASTFAPALQAFAAEAPATGGPAATQAPRLSDNAQYTRNVEAPFRVKGQFVTRTATGAARVTAVISGNAAIKLSSTKPVQVTLDVVKTGKKHQVQRDHRVITLKKGERTITGLLPGRTYLVKGPDGKSTRVTPMKKVNNIGGIGARFADTPKAAHVSADHALEWSRGNTNVQYWWAVSKHAGLTTRSFTTDTELVTSSNTSQTSVPLPDQGYIRLDVVAVNPLGELEFATFYSQTTVEDAWAALGAGGNLLMATTPPLLQSTQVTTGMTETEKADQNANLANSYADRARGAADAARYAAGRAKDAIAAGNPEAATKAATDAHEEAAIARAAAIDANNYKNQIPGDTQRDARLDAEAAVKAAQDAADIAEHAAATASMYAAQAWRDEAVRALNELANGHAALTGDEAIAFAVRLADRAAYAAQMAAYETSRINTVKYPDMAAEAVADTVEAAEAALAAEALEQEVRARVQGVRAAVDATTPAEATLEAAKSRQAAIEARAAANAAAAAKDYPGQIYDTRSAEAAERAEAYATEAEAARDDVIHRDAAQQYQAKAEAELAAAAATTDAASARPHLDAARAAAAAAEAEAAAVRDSSDEKAAAVAAATAARAAAVAAEQYAIASQALLDEQLVIDTGSLTVQPGGNTSIKFAKNPNDARASIEYTAFAVNKDAPGITGVPGTIVDNGDGTITVSWSGLAPTTNGYEIVIVPTSYGERTSSNPTKYAPNAIDTIVLQSLLSMGEASSMEVCGETPKAIGVMEGAQCVSTLPLKYDTAPVEYEQKWTVVSSVETTPAAYAANVGPLAQGAACPWGGSEDGGLCVFPRTFQDTWGWADDTSKPKSQATRAARIDSHFSDDSWTLVGSGTSTWKYVARSPLPAGDFNTALHTYTYEPAKGTYVTRNIPAISKTYRPVFASLPNGVIGWDDLSPARHTGELSGGDTGRFQTTVTVSTIGGKVSVTGPIVDGTARDR